MCLENKLWHVVQHKLRFCTAQATRGAHHLISAAVGLGFAKIPSFLAVLDELN